MGAILLLSLLSVLWNLGYGMRNDSMENVRVRIGHIGSQSAMPKAEAIIEICRQELWADGILNNDFDIEVISQTGCGESFEGVAVGADMYHQQNVKAFIGPYCNAELDAVSKMASYWNVPIIGYMASSNVFADKTIYKTQARVSLRTTNALALAVYTIIKHYSWQNVAIVTNTGALAFERTAAFEEIFHNRGINVIKKVMFDENVNAQSIVASGYLEEIKNNARIIICLFSSTRTLSKEFMQAVFSQEMNNNEFVFIFPWLQAEAQETSPWVGANGEVLANVKQHFANSIIIDDVNGFNIEPLLIPFRQRIGAAGISVDQLNIDNLYGYLHLYDSLKLYALAARQALNETGERTIVTDGRYLWNKMRRMTFPGLATWKDNATNGSDTAQSSSGIAAGTVIMDDLAERAGIYAAFFVTPSRDTVLKVVEMTPYPVSNCDGIKNKSGCFELNVVDIQTGFWPSLNGALPADTPKCGFRNEKCDYTLIIVIGALVLGLILAATSAFCVYRIWEKKSLDKTPWRILRDDMRVLNEEEMKSMLSVGSSRTKLSNVSKFSKHHAIIGTNTHASFHMYPQRKPIKFAREDMQTLAMVKAAVHDNLNPFLGMAFNEKEEMIILWKFCSRGTVQDIIYNDSLNLDSKFHAAFVRDITLGLDYLHSSQIGYHGSLTSWACLIDRNWMVKLTDYGVANSLEKWQKRGMVDTETLKDGEDKSGSAQATSILYQPPELIKNRDMNKRRNTDQTWIRQTQARRQAGDIYSFGIVMYEILCQNMPFADMYSTEDIAAGLKDGSKAYRPSIQDKTKVSPDLIALLQDCWASNPEARPNIRRVRLNTERYLQVKGSLVDQMMRMMEQYANNLEKIVQERTGMLEEANKRADKLLSQLLPAYVANELKLGKSIPPKTFKHASVMFSDIVGFTTICSSASPIEVVTMLNEVYTGFDDIINRHEAYKVETIGDAYMVVSGIPIENGIRHLMHLSDVALEMMEFLNDFKVPHRKDDRIKIRLGLHTGPVAAGVVGLTAPRYCLFGDTVNMASRMESTGVPEKVQISEPFKLNLNQHYPEFLTELRGTVEIKGKGSCTTYFLDKKNKDSQQL